MFKGWKLNQGLGGSQMSTHTRTQLTGGESYLHLSLSLSLSLPLSVCLSLVMFSPHLYSHSSFQSTCLISLIPSTTLYFLVDSKVSCISEQGDRTSHPHSSFLLALSLSPLSSKWLN